jgi:hypothetical protein
LRGRRLGHRRGGQNVEDRIEQHFIAAQSAGIDPREHQRRERQLERRTMRKMFVLPPAKPAPARAVAHHDAQLPARTAFERGQHRHACRFGTGERGHGKTGGGQSAQNLATIHRAHANPNSDQPPRIIDGAPLRRGAHRPILAHGWAILGPSATPPAE